MKVYVASSFLNKPAAREMQDLIRRFGHEITYDWTVHPDTQNWDRFAEECLLDLNGVRVADVLVVVLPGRRGTATELGMALALHKTVLVLALDETTRLEALNGSVFWHHPNVQMTNDAIEIVQYLNDLDEREAYFVEAEARRNGADILQPEGV